MAKWHVRHMVGGRAPAKDEVLYRFEFPERPGALLRFLDTMRSDWNISLFHYRNHGADYGRVLVGIQVPRDEMRAFRSFLEEHAAVCLALLRVVSLRLRDADAKRIEFARFDTMGRIAVRLIELSERFGREQDDGVRITLPLSQEDLAGLTGSSLRSVSRALEEMRSLRWIETGRRDIRILDRAALERRAR